MEGGTIGEPSPESAALLRTGSAVDLSTAPGSEINSVAGIVYKWTNYGKGWRSRWFTLRGNGVLSYSKTSDVESQTEGDLILIGSVGGDRRGGSKRGKSGRIVHLKICSFRESKSDDRKFYIFTATKSLHLRTKTVKERVAWMQALISLRTLFSLRQQSINASLLTRELSVSTERLKQRLRKDGLGDGLVRDCEQIMLSEFSGIQGQVRTLCEERSCLLDTLRKLEAANISAERPGMSDGEYLLMKNMYNDIPSRKYNEWSTTESLDDVKKQEVEETSDDELHFFDAEEELCSEADTGRKIMAQEYSSTVRRKKLPDPVEKEKTISLWSVIKDNIGKDLTRVCLPVYFNEPISSLQKCFEDMEYSHLLDQAHEHGKAGNSLMRILNVAAFAVSGYASSEGRHRKPFNPLLGETYEADYPEKGLRFFSEKVSHHPTVIACHCEGRGWKFWCDTNLKSKFWGRSIQLDPVGTLNLEFDDGEIFKWSKVTTSIYNLIIGNVNCDHHGTMHIHGNGKYSCRIKFKERSIMERTPHQIHGFVEDISGKKVARVFGKWDDSVYYSFEDDGEQFLLWRRNKPPENLTHYNLTSFAVTLNELTPGLKILGLDQINGIWRWEKFDKANVEKLRLETRQRMSAKLQENGWKPRWFHRDGDGPFHYVGGYWEARERGDWGECSDIFGEISQDHVNLSECH